MNLLIEEKVNPKTSLIPYAIKKSLLPKKISSYGQYLFAREKDSMILNDTTT